jgi:hypothetical protein
MVVVALVASPLGGSQAPAGSGRSSSKGPPIRVEFRVFDGAAEITSQARVRVRKSGTAETGTVVDGGDLSVNLAPGIYDAEAVREQTGDTVDIRWADHLVVMAYPDEGGRHLEVINFAKDFGALQLRLPEGQAPDPAGTAVAIFKAGDGHAMPSRVLRGLGYMLLVVPADMYDVRVIRPGRPPVTLTGVEVPAGGTRMKIIQ